MPTKEITPHKIGIMTEDGFQELSNSIEDITLEPEEPVSDTESVIVNRNVSFECSFKLKGNIYLKFLRTMKYGSNNWRKMHGLPMIRKQSNKYGK